MQKVFLGIIGLLIIIGILVFINRPQTKSTKDIVMQSTPTPKPTPTATASVSATLSQTATPAAATDIVSANTAVIKIAKGNITIQLYPDDAPKTVKNFATLAKRGYYNNLTFHRVVPGFVIQGGDPNGDGSGGTSIYGNIFNDELNPTTKSYQDGYKEGVVAMANRGPNTNGSQFFIMLADHPELPKNYTIFGKVTSGMDVVKQIQVGDKMLSITVQ